MKLPPEGWMSSLSIYPFSLVVSSDIGSCALFAVAFIFAFVAFHIWFLPRPSVNTLMFLDYYLK